MSIFEELSSKLKAASTDELRQIIISTGMPSYALHAAERELEMLSRTGPDTPEYGNILTCIAYLISLPWNKKTGSSPDIKRVESVLDADTRCPQEIKGKILKHLAVKMLNDGKRPRILVVDDEKIAIESLEHALAKEGYTVVAANSGAEAVKKLETDCFDIVITDLIMGDIDGHAVLKEVKNKYPGTKLIMITGYATVDTAVEAMRMGAFHYIEKPIKLEEVRSTVRDALRQKPSGKNTVLCFAGHMRTETASLGETIAEALGRTFLKISLSEMKEPSEITGRTRSAEGAMPGRIIEELCSAGVADPVIMIEGLDRTGEDPAGGLGHALLELFDPGRNHNFVDRYLKVPFDLSNVVFIAAAEDSENIYGPVKDILEIINV